MPLLKSFGKRIKVVTIKNPSGNKSYAQEIGMKHVTNGIVVTTDADTILDEHFIEEIVKKFEDRTVIACAGLVKSVKHNWLTACRQLEYIIGQNIHKHAQSHINALFVIPGCAAAYRTRIFKKHISMDHDTVTEDLDFTYKHHRKGFKIAYAKKAIVYTQDPATIRDYVHQLRRWYAGSWQNLIKHRKVLEKPNNAFELSLIFAEGLVFPFMLILALLFNRNVFLYYYLSYTAVALIFALYALFSEKRPDVLLIVPIHLFISFINYVVFLEQFVYEVFLNKNNSVWIQPKRRAAL